MMPEPDLSLGGLSTWVERRQFPDSSDYWDANWLLVRARMVQSSASVEFRSSAFMTSDFAQFHAELKSASATLSGEARLQSLEPDLQVILQVGRIGQVMVQVEITPDHLTQRHWFELGLDQSYLPPLIDGCEALLQRFPVIGKP